MTSEGLWEMFEGDSADMCAVKFVLMSMGDRAEGLAGANLGVRTPVSGNPTVRATEHRSQIQPHNRLLSCQDKCRKVQILTFKINSFKKYKNCHQEQKNC
jgi:hypothetical protein